MKKIITASLLLLAVSTSAFASNADRINSLVPDDADRLVERHASADLVPADSDRLVEGITDKNVVNASDNLVPADSDRLVEGITDKNHTIVTTSK
jgi:hypothetical protein